ncbi:MAG: HesA/MoeB/ThiF family protein [Moraxellaceae bacterium]
MDRQFSVAMTEALHRQAKEHLLRSDHQEDVCFAIWYPGEGSKRTTSLIHRLILPKAGDRKVHGNASFEAQFFQRALEEAAKAGGGLALLHSHPFGEGWQGMSPDDIVAEQGHAAATYGATGLPLVGLTLAGDEHWSARFWQRVARRQYKRRGCGLVRVVGQKLAMTYLDKLIPRPSATAQQRRTVSAWGEQTQADMVRLRVGVVGLGSVGGMIAEALARTGFSDVVLIDFDHVEEHNLDRLIYAKLTDVGRLKADVLAEVMQEHATAQRINIRKVATAVYEEEGFRAALDCDVLFACVDRPWGREVLNLMAHAYLIPVVDGGIAVRMNQSGRLTAADWRAHTATVGRPCLLCLGQYNGSHAQMEREGLLDNQRYIEGLPKDHVLRAGENVFAFSMACASLQMMQMLSLVIAPLGLSNPGSQLYHFVGGTMEAPEHGTCHKECLFPSLVALGDTCGVKVTGDRMMMKPQPADHVANTRAVSIREFLRKVFRTLWPL